MFNKKPPLMAFVTFNSSWAQQECMRRYPSSLFHYYTQSSTHRLRGSRLSVEPAMPPSTITFENLGYSMLNRLCRQVCFN